MPQQQSHSSHQRQHPPHQRRRVLVVENDETIARAIARRLDAEGFAVQVAGDGESAVRAYASGRHELVVLDRPALGPVRRPARRGLRTGPDRRRAEGLRTWPGTLAAAHPGRRHSRRHAGVRRLESLQVAQTQLNVRTTDTLDVDYLGGLGADAVPVLDRLPEPTRTCVLREVVAGSRLDEPDPWNGWNLARARARDILARNPLVESVACNSSYRS
jgi:hypothetical protein